MSDLLAERHASGPPELDIEEVRELVAEGREQGYLNAGRLHDALQDVDLTPEQIDDIFILLGDLGIDVIDGDQPIGADAREPQPVEEEAVEPEVIRTLDLSVKSASNDPVRVYLHVMRVGEEASSKRFV